MRRRLREPGPSAQEASAVEPGDLPVADGGDAAHDHMKDAARLASVPVEFQRIGSMFCAYFTDKPVHNLADAMLSMSESL